MESASPSHFEWNEKSHGFVYLRFCTYIGDFFIHNGVGTWPDVEANPYIEKVDETPPFHSSFGVGVCVSHADGWFSDRFKLLGV